MIFYPLALAVVATTAGLAVIEGTEIEEFKLRMDRDNGDWCVECMGGPDTCQTGSKLEIRACDQAKMRFRIQDVGENKAQFVANTSSGIYCLEMRLWWGVTQLQKCNNSNPYQKFGPGQGNFNGAQFEVVSTEPTSGFTGDTCLSPESADPIPGERVWQRPCDDARPSDTTFFNKLSEVVAPVPRVEAPLLLTDEEFKLRMDRDDGDWCVECMGGPDACQKGSKLESRPCDQAKMRFRIQDAGENKAQFVAITSSGIYCLQMMKWWGVAKFKECSHDNPYQKFGPGQGNFNGAQFEVVSTEPTTGFTGNTCLSPESLDPIPGKTVWQRPCDDARPSNTTLFNKLSEVEAPVPRVKPPVPRVKPPFPPTDEECPCFNKDDVTDFIAGVKSFGYCTYAVSLDAENRESRHVTMSVSSSTGFEEFSSHGTTWKLTVEDYKPSLTWASDSCGNEYWKFDSSSSGPGTYKELVNNHRSSSKSLFAGACLALIDNDEVKEAMTKAGCYCT